MSKYPLKLSGDSISAKIGEVFSIIIDYIKWDTNSNADYFPPRDQS
jgi:hypothetical protein